MKKYSVLILAIIVVFLSVAYWLVSPLFIDKYVSEEFPNVTSSDNTTKASVILNGTFEGFDAIHTGSGNVSIIKTSENQYVIRFEENFVVANGPDLFVGLGKDGEYKKDAQIASLKGNIGSQNYELPSNLDIRDYDEVWIWCRVFSVPFAKAKLKNSTN